MQIDVHAAPGTEPWVVRPEHRLALEPVSVGCLFLGTPQSSDLQESLFMIVVCAEGSRNHNRTPLDGVALLLARET